MPAEQGLLRLWNPCSDVCECKLVKDGGDAADATLIFETKLVSIEGKPASSEL